MTAPRARYAAALAFGLVGAVAGNANAQLRDAAARVADAFRAVGAFVTVDKPRFLQDDQALVVTLPALPEGNCTTVVFLGPRGLGFDLGASGGDDDPAARIESEAGAMWLAQCGEPMPERLAVTTDSGRGALETIVARSSDPLPPLQVILPERTGVGLGPAPEPGFLPTTGSPERRAEVAELRAKRDGAAVSPRTVWHAGSDGAGVGSETLPPGCHTIVLLPSDPKAGRAGRRIKLDLDAEMRDIDDDQLLARDRTDAPDALLPTCVGETTQVGIVFVGAPAGALVLVSHVAWALPAHLPSVWGSDACGRMARAILERHLPALPADPVQIAQGGSGTTTVPLSIEPGACYVAVMALAEGVARSVGLRVHVRAMDAADDRGIDDSSALVAFCAGDRTTASAEVDVRGTPLVGWGLALYRLQTGVWDPTP